MRRAIATVGLLIVAVLVPRGAASADGGTATVPSPPTNVTARRTCYGPQWTCAIVVAWSPPASDGGSPVVGYTVTGDPSSEPFSVPAAQPYMCWGAQAPQFWDATFVVTASNTAGKSSWGFAQTTPVQGTGGGPSPVTARNDGAKDDVLTFHYACPSVVRGSAMVDGQRHAFTVANGLGTVTLPDGNGAKPTTYTVRLRGTTKRLTVR